jgi:hypothetical protein
MSVYIEALHRNLPRLLASFNMDETHALAGVGDRYFWGWKLIDFPNGTFQGAVHGLAILISLNQLPKTVSLNQLLKTLSLMVRGLKTITAKNGSLDEAFPNEYSFCVTSLVASDVLAGLKLLKDKISTKEHDIWIDSVRPLIEFLLKQDEYHGVISNHLASAALAMYRWYALTGEKEKEQRGSIWIKRILSHQSKEGWFSEYGGADPGYQSWCTTQLAQLNLLRPDLGLQEPLTKSLDFLSYAAHPDGSFGGVYGSRNTRFLLPGGIEMLAESNNIALALANFAKKGICNHSFVTLDAIDSGNLIPFINDYALAAKADIENKQNKVEEHILPCYQKNIREYYPEAGWLIDSQAESYSIINVKRGGGFVHFSNKNKPIISSGILCKNYKKEFFSSQQGQATEIDIDMFKNDCFALTFPLYKVSRPIPTPGSFFILRFLSLTLFKFRPIGNLTKRILAWYLMGRKKEATHFVERRFNVGETFSIKDTLLSSTNYKLMEDTVDFSSIHMASQAYWKKDTVNERITNVT